MRIYTDKNGLAVNAISVSNCVDVLGREYQVIAGGKVMQIDFQFGDPAKVGVNGLTNEAMLSMLLHRMEKLESEKPCKENRAAIVHMKLSLDALNARHAEQINVTQVI